MTSSERFQSERGEMVTLLNEIQSGLSNLADLDNLPSGDWINAVIEFRSAVATAWFNFNEVE